MPIQFRMVLRRPDFGEARIDHATAPTNGGTNNGIMLAAAMNLLHGVSVRTTTQENVRPISTASSVPPPQAIIELASARRTFGLPRTVMKFVSDKLSTPKPSTTGLVLVSAPSNSIETG